MLISIIGSGNEEYPAVVKHDLFLRQFFIGYWIKTGLDFYPAPGFMY